MDAEKWLYVGACLIGAALLHKAAAKTARELGVPTIALALAGWVIGEAMG